MDLRNEETPDVDCNNSSHKSYVHYHICPMIRICLPMEDGYREVGYLPATARDETICLKIPTRLLTTGDRLRTCLVCHSDLLSQRELPMAMHRRICKQAHSIAKSIARELAMRHEDEDIDMMIHVDVNVVETQLYDNEMIRALRESIEAHEPMFRPATTSSIEALEKVRLDGSESIKECTICLEKLELGLEVTRLPCKHLFPGDCIGSWLERSHMCPNCRIELPQES